MSDRWGFYLSGCGSLDGSDVMTSVIAYEILQSIGIEPVPVSRDIDQGRVIEHRFAQERDQERNALEESARIVRGNISDMRELEPDQLDAAVLVGGGGTLHTWLDYHERGSDCRITERLKYQLLDFMRNGKPVLCIGNTYLPVAFVLHEEERLATFNTGDHSTFSELIRDWGMQLSDEIPCWNEEPPVGTLPNVTSDNNVNRVRSKLQTFLQSAVERIPA